MRAQEILVIAYLGIPIIRMLVSGVKVLGSKSCLGHGLLRLR